MDQVLGWGLEVELGVGILLLRFLGLTGGVTGHDIRSVFLFSLVYSLRLSWNEVIFRGFPKGVQNRVPN